MKDFESVMCCFCGKSLAHKESVEITISMVNSEELQSLFSHGKCLKKVVDKSVPIGIDIDNENETS
jgi:hypothetical protein